MTGTVSQNHDISSERIFTFGVGYFRLLTRFSVLLVLFGVYNKVEYRKGFKNTLEILSETRYSYNGNNSSSESSEFASNDQNSQSNTLTESSGKFY